MFLAEPQSTNYDVNFSIAGIPIRIHPFFWLAALVLGSPITQNNPNAGPDLLIWVIVFLASILVHELGHAFTMRYFGETPRIVLYMLGGLAIADRGFGQFTGGSSARNSNRQILISAAGPGAGFLLAALTAATIFGLGGLLTDDGQIIEEVSKARWHLSGWLPLSDWLFFVPPETSPQLAMLFRDLLLVNIFWGILNLLPLYPLDGGHIARELIIRFDPNRGTTTSLWLSFFTGCALAVGSLVYMESIFMALWFGSLAYSNYVALQRFGGGGFGGRPW